MSVTSADRRACPRMSDGHGVTSMRVRPGHTATIADVSAAGVRVDTASRLLPGRFVELQMERDGQRITCRGEIVRCAVLTLRAEGVSYQAAIRFDGYRIPGLAPMDPTERVDLTQIVA